MRVCFKNNFANFQPDPVWNDKALAFEQCPEQEQDK